MSQIITFYSYKGGAGRSMTAANVAWILASNGKRVLIIDWDLEAPGLHRYFHPFLVDPELLTTDGIVDFIINFTVAALTPGDAAEDWYVPYANIIRYASSLTWDFPRPGTLDFISAGRQDTAYVARVSSIDWSSFYERLGGGAFLEAAKRQMRAEYDYILIDSRTGISDSSGICTIQMPDQIVACVTPNRQSMLGTAAVMAAVQQHRTNDNGPPVRVFPVLMRVEYAEKQWLVRVREAFASEFGPFLGHLPTGERERYLGRVEFPYVPYYSYSEVLPAFGDSGESPFSLLAPAERLASYLSDGEVSKLGATTHAERQAVLARYPNPWTNP